MEMFNFSLPSVCISNRKSNFCASSPYPIISFVDCALNIRPSIELCCPVVLDLSCNSLFCFFFFVLFVFLLLLPLMANKVVYNNNFNTPTTAAAAKASAATTSTVMFIVLSSWQSNCVSSPGLFDECRTAPSGRRPKTKPDDLGCESACTGCQSLHPPSPFIIITQPESWYSFYVPRRVEGWVDLVGWLHNEIIIHSFIFVYKQLTYATEQMRLQKMNKTTVEKNFAKQ